MAIATGPMRKARIVAGDRGDHFFEALLGTEAAFGEDHAGAARSDRGADGLDGLDLSGVARCTVDEMVRGTESERVDTGVKPQLAHQHMTRGIGPTVGQQCRWHDCVEQADVSLDCDDRRRVDELCASDSNFGVERQFCDPHDVGGPLAVQPAVESIRVGTVHLPAEPGGDPGHEQSEHAEDLVDEEQRDQREHPDAPLRSPVGRGVEDQRKDCPQRIEADNQRGCHNDSRHHQNAPRKSCEPRHERASGEVFDRLRHRRIRVGERLQQVEACEPFASVGQFEPQAPLVGIS